MTAAGALVAALAVLLPAAAAPAPPEVEAPTVQLFGSAAEALRAVADRDLRVIAFGELHQRTSTRDIPSALQRFTAELWPELAARAAELVVETWVTDGRCGQAEKAAAEDIEKTTARPAETENELVTLLRRAKESGAAPRILQVSCAEYQSLFGSGDRVDYDRLLSLTTRHLSRAVQRALRRRGQGARDLVLVYGGALHNDLHPMRELAGYSFARSAFLAAAGRFAEVDLYVPEYVDAQPALRAEPWYARWRPHRLSGKTALIRRSARSFIIVFPAHQR